MTDFDFEILSAISLYGTEGVERQTLERKHFIGYSIEYELAELSKPDVKIEELFSGVTIKHSIKNSAFLACREIVIPNVIIGLPCNYRFYSLTDKGRTVLINWQRRKAEQAKKTRQREKWNLILSFTIGTVSGIAASFIYSKILGI